jgi:CobQ-like glutamine amidotransferase family enzyme
MRTQDESMRETCELHIAHLYPELLNLYGDRGNVICIRQRCAWRGIETVVHEVHLGEVIDYRQIDIVFIGGGSDREELLVCDALLASKDELQAFVDSDGVLLAVCGGYQLLGAGYLIGDEKVAGLSLFDADTSKGEGRLVGNVAIRSDLCVTPIVGFENHAGRTTLGASCTPLGTVIKGYGNNGDDGLEGARYHNAIGTYLHGPLLPKNPELTDWLIQTALNRRYGHDIVLSALDDQEEQKANQVAVERLGERLP